MRNCLLVLAVVLITAGCAGEDFEPGEIVALERAALDRWGRGDPQGYIETMAEDVTYFDPTQDQRIDGLDAMKGLVQPITGKIRVDRFEILHPQVQRRGDMAVLTFNVVSYVKGADGAERPVARWNTTEVYRRDGGRWRIIHSHWSYVKPELRQPTQGTM